MITSILVLVALYAAFLLGKMAERPKAKWPRDASFLNNWEKQRPFAMGLVAGAALLQALAIKNGGMGGGMGMGMGGMGGGMY